MEVFDQVYLDSISSISAACITGDTKKLREILDDTDQDRVYGLIRTPDNRGYQPLHFAAERGNASCARVLLDHDGVEVNGQTWNNETPLALACKKLSSSMQIQTIVHLLNHAEVDVNRMNNDGLGPLHFAVKNRCLPVIKYLIRRGADVNLSQSKDQCRPLDMVRHWCNREENENPNIKQTSDEIVQYFIKHGADLCTVRKRLPPIILTLFRHGYHNEVMNENFLHSNEEASAGAADVPAVRFVKEDKHQALLKLLNLKDGNGMTTFMSVIVEGLLDVLNYILSIRLKPGSDDENGADSGSGPAGDHLLPGLLFKSAIRMTDHAPIVLTVVHVACMCESSLTILLRILEEPALSTPEFDDLMYSLPLSPFYFALVYGKFDMIDVLADQYELNKFCNFSLSNGVSDNPTRVTFSFSSRRLSDPDPDLLEPSNPESRERCNPIDKFCNKFKVISSIISSLAHNYYQISQMGVVFLTLNFGKRKWLSSDFTLDNLDQKLPDWWIQAQGESVMPLIVALSLRSTDLRPETEGAEILDHLIAKGCRITDKDAWTLIFEQDSSSRSDFMSSGPTVSVQVQRSESMTGVALCLIRAGLLNPWWLVDPARWEAFHTKESPLTSQMKCLVGQIDQLIGGHEHLKIAISSSLKNIARMQSRAMLSYGQSTKLEQEATTETRVIIKPLIHLARRTIVQAIHQIPPCDAYTKLGFPSGLLGRMKFEGEFELSDKYFRTAE